MLCTAQQAVLNTVACKRHSSTLVSYTIRKCYTFFITNHSIINGIKMHFRENNINAQSGINANEHQILKTAILGYNLL